MVTTLIAASAMLVAGTTEVTVYNQGLGFIKDVRTLHLKKGLQSALVEDVAQMIDATSVGFKCVNNPGSVSVIEQNYRYDLISPQAILEKSVGKRIRCTRTMGNTKERIQGVLLSSPTAVVSSGGFIGKDQQSELTYNGLVMRADDGRIILSPEGEIDVLEVPEGLISKPTLVWELNSDKEQDAKMELNYLTEGMNWTANYVFTLDNSNLGDIQGWVTLDNQSGYSFKDATLKLLAGEVNVVRAENAKDPVFLTYASGDAVFRKKAMTEENLFEYHLYTVNRPASVQNKEQKQLSLLEGTHVPYKKQISFEATTGESETGLGDLDAAVKIKFTNDEKSHLGMPMPAGKFRLYQRDTKGSLQFIGEDTIKHTPRDEKVSLSIGKAFDVKASHKRTAYVVTSKRSSKSMYEVEFRNRKEEAQTVYYTNHFQNAQWKVSENSDPFVKEDSNSIVFELKLKPGEVKMVTYQVEYKW